MSPADTYRLALAQERHEAAQDTERDREAPDTGQAWAACICVDATHGDDWRLGWVRTETDAYHDSLRFEEPFPHVHTVNRQAVTP